MKKLFLIGYFLISIVNLFSQYKNQNDFNFLTFGYRYQVVTNKKIDMYKLCESSDYGKMISCDNCFNHFEIHLKKRQFIHRFPGESIMEKKYSKITKIVRTNEYIKFETETEQMGHVFFIINLIKNRNYDVIMKYKCENEIEVGFFKKNKPPF